MSEKPMLTQAQVRKRGWTLGLIKRFLPEPDKKVKVRFQRNPVYLYATDRITQVEESADFVDAKSKSLDRQQSAQKGVATKLNQTDCWLNSLQRPDIPDYNRDDLYKIAVDHYNALWEKRGQPEKFTTVEQSTAEFLNRIAGNFLRHMMTPYENELLQAYGLVGAETAKIAIKNRIQSAIYEKYPFIR